MEVRTETAADIDGIAEVHRQAFGGDSEKVVDLVAALRAESAADGTLSLVADDGGHVLGHVMFTPALLDAPKRLLDVQVLSPAGVLPAHQSTGIGSALIRRGLDLLTDRGVPLVFLEGAPGYYPRFGFTPGGELDFRKPSLRIPDVAFQVARLAAYQPWMTGTLVYPPVFWRMDAVGLRDPDD